MSTEPEEPEMVMAGQKLEVYDATHKVYRAASVQSANEVKAVAPYVVYSTLVNGQGLRFAKDLAMSSASSLAHCTDSVLASVFIVSHHPVWSTVARVASRGGFADPTRLIQVTAKVCSGW